jgi:iron(III) transport system ATP-binding protein
VKQLLPNPFGTKKDAAAEAAIVPRARVGATFAASLTFEDVRRRYGARTALDGFSLAVAPGEVVCLLGPSGCGKTTLLRVAAGIEKPSGGRILINDREVAGPARFVPPERRSVGLMFQDFALFPHLSILDNVAFGLKGLPREEARREALAVLSRFELEGYASGYPHILSGGQQQRVALARAIVPRPAVMLMDEPFSGLDVQLRESIQDETLALLRETRATSVIVTHHPEEAMRMGDRIAVMRDGRLEQEGQAEELFHRPVSLFVARLFSEVNEIPFAVRGGAIDTPIGRLPVRGIAEGAAAVLCIRERGIRMDTSESGLAGRVHHVKFLGDMARVEIGVEGFERPLRARVPEGHGLARGSEVCVTITPGDVLIFPAGPV